MKSQNDNNNIDNNDKAYITNQTVEIGCNVSMIQTGK